MRIAITGPTGFLGTAISAEARTRGDDLILLARSPDRAPKQPGTQVVDWSRGAAVDLPPHDAAIHLAGETVGQRWTEPVKREILESRRNGTRRLVDALAKMPADDRPRVLVSASAVGYYGERGEEILTEQSSPGAGYLVEVCEVWEEEARRAAQFGMRVVSLRLGVVLGRGGGALAQLLTPFKMGVGGPIGNGKQWFPWVHQQDVAGAFLWAVDTETVSGPVNVVAPGIVRGTEFARTLGKTLHRPAFLPTPVFGLRLLLGEFADHLAESQHVVPRAALDGGYQFRHPDLAEALQDILG